MTTYAKVGDWNAICDVCGFQFKASEMRKRWDGAMVCKDDWEPRHPQELRRALRDSDSVPWTRPRPADVFILVCTVSGRSAVAGRAMAGCAISGRPFTGP